MKKCIWLGLTLVLFLAPPLLLEFLAHLQAQGQKKVLPDPTPRKEQILELFVKEFIQVTPGKGKFPASFMMGSTKGLLDAQPAHKVTMIHPFAMAKYEVTQELYHVIMGKNPARWQGLRNSVEMLSWEEANAFCQKVTAELKKRKLIGEDEEIRLPTEAEWEYVCRAGTTTTYSFGDDVKDLTMYSWYSDNSKGHDPPVGAKKPNPWGFYDMHGYISEWCADDWVPGYKDAPTDGSARKAAGAKEKIIRGGSFADPPEVHRSDFRSHVAAGTLSDRIGFRCVRAKIILATKGGNTSGK